MTMAVDAQQAEKHLAGMPSETELKDRMVRQIVGDQTIPTALQFALSQRYYYEALAAGGIFWARNDPDAQWIECLGERRHFLVHWAVWDTQVNLPVVYLMDLEDSAKKPLPNDAYRWPEVQHALMAQSVGGLKLLTIATGFDKDFADLHPKRLRRIILGPMYSASFTLQSGPISKVLEGREGARRRGLGAGLDGGGSGQRPRGRGEGRLVLDRRAAGLQAGPGGGGRAGGTRQERMIILPEKPYQVLVEQNPKGLQGLRKFVVGAGGRLIPTL
jgi:hypothetical protein